LFEESVHAEAAFVNTTTVEEIRTLIREAGFEPVQRTTLYERLPETPLESIARHAPRRGGRLDPHALPVVG
ncbi:MAG: hypothetical protein ACREK7_03935, partial [Gemmatimonadota bacterium]